MGLALGVIGQSASRLDSSIAGWSSVGFEIQTKGSREVLKPRENFSALALRTLRLCVIVFKVLQFRRIVLSLLLNVPQQRLLSVLIPSKVQCTAATPSSFFGIAGCPAIARRR